jgi:putative membrane protein (TIGR04086 family)
MKSTWLHSIVLIAIFSLLLSASHQARYLAVPPYLSAPIAALSVLVPGLVLGWFTRRHPLLVGGTAGAVSIVIIAFANPAHPRTQSLTGDIIAIGLYAAVATLAGRALKYRFAR